MREGRLTRGQARALEQFWHVYGVDFSPSPLDLEQVFARTAPKILEIGPGMGETTVALAARHPENDYLAAEVHRPGVGSLIRQAALQQLGNIRVIRHDAAEILQYQLAEKSLDAVYLFFPDPWPKKRHHKRRLISPDFASLLASRLKSHGRLIMLTDIEVLACHMREACDACGDLYNLAGRGRFAPRPCWLPTTKFETRGARLGHGTWCLAYAVNLYPATGNGT